MVVRNFWQASGTSFSGDHYDHAKVRHSSCIHHGFHCSANSVLADLTRSCYQMLYNIKDRQQEMKFHQDFLQGPSASFGRV
jgi:hypothetical protein